jgi:hypothetical protein
LILPQHRRHVSSAGTTPTTIIGIAAGGAIESTIVVVDLLGWGCFHDHDRAVGLREAAPDRHASVAFS